MKYTTDVRRRMERRRADACEHVASARTLAFQPSRPRTTDELQERVMQMLGGSAKRILKPLIGNYPDAITKEELMKQAGYSNMMSKGFANTVSRLRTLKLIDYPERGYVVALPMLFLGN